MASYKIILQRLSFSEVVVEAATAAEARAMLTDEELAYDLFHGSPNTWYAPEIKVKSVKRDESK